MSPDDLIVEVLLEQNQTGTETMDDKMGRRSYGSYGRTVYLLSRVEMRLSFDPFSHKC